MPIITRRIPHLIQPQYPARAKDSGLALNFATGADAARGSDVVFSGSPALVPNSLGVCRSFNADTKYATVTRKGAALFQSGPFNLVFNFKQIGAAINGGLILQVPGTSGDNNLVNVYTLNTGVIRCDMWSLSGSPTTADTAAFLNSGGTYTVELISDGTTFQWYVNGIASGSSASMPPRDGESTTIYVGGGPVSTTPNHDVALVAIRGSSRSVGLNPWQLFEDRKQNIYVSAAGGGQTLTPSLYSDGDTFYAPTVAPGSVALTPSLFTDTDTFHTPTVSHGLTAGLFADADTFYAPTVAPGSVTLSPALYADADTFYAPTVSLDGAAQTLTPSLYADADTFYSATVTPGSVSLTPSIYTDADTFYAATVAASYSLQPAAYADADTFYSATVSQSGDAVLQPGLFTDVDTFYAATVASVTFLSAPRQITSNTQSSRRSNTQTARRP